MPRTWSLVTDHHPVDRHPGAQPVRRQPAAGRARPRTVGQANRPGRGPAHPRTGRRRDRGHVRAAARGRGAGVAVLLISTELEEVMALASRIAVISAAGSPASSAPPRPPPSGSACSWAVRRHETTSILDRSRPLRHPEVPATVGSTVRPCSGGPGPGALTQAWLTSWRSPSRCRCRAARRGDRRITQRSVVALFDGSIADAAAWSQTLLNAAPLLLVAVGACIGNRAGVFNIGQEGQVLIGAMVACSSGSACRSTGCLVITVASWSGRSSAARGPGSARCCTACAASTSWSARC